MKINSELKYALTDLTNQQLDVLVRSLEMFDCYNEDELDYVIAIDLLEDIKDELGDTT